MVQSSTLWLEALDEMDVFSKSISSENTFEDILYSVKYLGAVLLITYLFLCVYDCTDSTLTNMNEWIQEELRVMLYIPHQKSEVLLLKKRKKHRVFQAHFCCAGVCSPR